MQVVVTTGGAMFVLCRGEGTVDIRRTNWDDEDLGTISGKGTEEGKLLWPVSMAMDGEERLYVSDEALDRITVFDTEGECLGIWGEKGSGRGQLNRPSGIAFDADGNLLVVDTLNHRVQRFTRDGRFLAGWGAYGKGEGQLNMPWGICVDDRGDVYVADWRNDRVQKFAPDGRFLFSIGGPGAGNGEFNRPAGVAVDADGDIYVADWGNDRVQQFAPDGRYLDKFIGDASLSRSGIDYLMANAKPMRLREMSVLEPQKRLRRPTSVTVDGQGRMFVTDYGSHRVQVYQKQAIALTRDQIASEQRSPTLQTT
jgi:DNA-binding beta-propeller fold protein YncE